MLRSLLLLLVVAAAGYAQEPASPRGPAPESAPAVEEPAAQPEAPTAAAAESEEERAVRRRSAQRGLVAMMLLVLTVVVLIVVLMILSARWTRYRFSAEGRPKPTTLEDLWWRVKEETLPEVDIDKILSEDSDQKQEPPQKPEEKGE